MRVNKAVNIYPLIGISQGLREVSRVIKIVAPTETTVLIRGESGTGKEFLAQEIHRQSLINNRPFVPYDCRVDQEILNESEIFGYKKGTEIKAFDQRFAKIEQASGGTIFFKEIGEASLKIQSKLVKLFQEKPKNLEKVKTWPNIRIIASSSKDLDQEVNQGRFSEDLYARLKIVTIALPSLRHRREDIPILANCLLNKLSKAMKIENPGLTLKAKESLVQHNWPGNLSELTETLKAALARAGGSPIAPDNLKFVQPEKKEDQQESSKVDLSVVKQWIREFLTTRKDTKLFENCRDQFTSLVIREALNLTNGNRSQAAKLLGLSRPTLHSKMDRFGIKIRITADRIKTEEI